MKLRNCIIVTKVTPMYKPWAWALLRSDATPHPRPAPAPPVNATPGQ